MEAQNPQITVLRGTKNNLEAYATSHRYHQNESGSGSYATNLSKNVELFNDGDVLDGGDLLSAFQNCAQKIAATFVIDAALNDTDE